MIFGRYIASSFFKAAAIVLLLLLSLFSFLSLVEALDDVGKGTYSIADAVSSVILTTPARIIDLLPVVALLGSVLGLGALANQREIIAMRASGVSPWHLARVLAGIAALISVVAILVQIYIVPAAERQAQEFHSRTLEQTELGGTEFWSRRGQRLIRVGKVDFGRIPRAIEIYEIALDGRLERMLSADKADVINATEWLLYNVEEKILAADTISHRHLESLRWASFLSPEQLSTLIAPAHALSAFDLYHYLSESADSGLDMREHESLFWQQVSLPLALFAMVLLGLPVVLGSTRTRSTGARTVFGAAIGISFYLFEQTTAHLAVLLELQPAAMALAPALLILAAALAAIWRSA